MMSQILPLNAVSQILAVSTDHLNEGGVFCCLLSVYAGHCLGLDKRQKEESSIQFRNHSSSSLHGKYMWTIAETQIYRRRKQPKG